MKIKCDEQSFLPPILQPLSMLPWEHEDVMHGVTRNGSVGTYNVIGNFFLPWNLPSMNARGSQV